MDAKKIVLVTEDESAYRRILTERLTSEGFEVVAAKNGEEGLALALEKHPDIILLDLVMPEMDGIEMAHKLREDEWGKSAKVIILTNLTDMVKVQEALDNRIFDFFVKTDVELEELVKKINDMLR